MGASHCTTVHFPMGNGLFTFLKRLASLGLELTSDEYAIGVVGVEKYCVHYKGGR
jgi:hypothetical protein